MEYKRIFKDGSHLFAGKIGTVIIGLVNFMILTRILTTEQMGQYSLFFMFVQFALVMGLNWSDASVVRHGREEFVKSGKINKSFWARMKLVLPAVSVFTFLFLLFSKHITNFLGLSRFAIWFLIFFFIFQGTLSFIMNIYRSIDEIKKSAYLILLQKILYLMFLCFVFFIGGTLTSIFHFC